MGKRNFMRALAGFGVSLSTIPHLSKDALGDLTDDLEDEVPRLSRLQIQDEEELEDRRSAPQPAAGEQPSEREPVFYTIPRDEWERTEATYDAAARLERRLGRLDPNGKINVSVTDLVNGHHSRKGVRVEYTTLVQRELVRNDGDEGSRTPAGRKLSEHSDANVREVRHGPAVDLQTVRDEVPATVSGTASRQNAELLGHATIQPTEVENIPVVVEEREIVEEAYFNDAYRPLPGGCQMSKGPYWNSFCTLGTPAYDHDSSDYVLTTSGHCIKDDWGEKMYQPYGNGYSIGYPQHYIYEGGTNDAGYIDTDLIDYDDYKQEKISMAIADDNGGTDIYINGVMGYDSIKDNQGDSSWTVHKQGRTTGRDTGYLVSASPGRRLGRYELNQGIDSAGGDSGGPVFKKYGNVAYIIGHHNWGNRSDDDDGPAGNLMAHIENEMNIEVNYVV